MKRFLYKPRQTSVPRPRLLMQDPPGGRHDNDKEFFCDIQIAPTEQAREGNARTNLEEAFCEKPSYLPTNLGQYDPNKHLDIQFRLLREGRL